MIYHNYKFKTKEYQEKWIQELEHIDKNIKYVYKDRTEVSPFLNLYRKQFKATPAAIKENFHGKYTEERKFIIYLLLNFSSVSVSTIENEMKIPNDEILNIKNDTSLDTFYIDKVNKFFDNKDLKEGYLANKKAQLSLSEEVDLSK